MVYCVQAHLVFASASTRNTRLAQAQAFVLNKPRWDATVLEASEDPDPNAIDLSVRYTAKSDQTLVRGSLSGQAGIQPGSWIQVHDCPHDERKNVCAATASRQAF